MNRWSQVIPNDEDMQPYLVTTFKVPRFDLPEPSSSPISPIRSDVSNSLFAIDPEIAALTEKMHSLARARKYYDAEQVRSSIAQREISLQMQRTKECRSAASLHAAKVDEEKRRSMACLQEAFRLKVKSVNDEFAQKINVMEENLRKQKRKIEMEFQTEIIAGPRLSPELEGLIDEEKIAADSADFLTAWRCSELAKKLEISEKKKFALNLENDKKLKITQIKNKFNKNKSLLENELLRQITDMKAQLEIDRKYLQRRAQVQLLQAAH